MCYLNIFVIVYQQLAYT